MRAKRRTVWLALAALVLVLAGGAAGWWRYVNYVPEIPPQSVRLPSPNAYDDYLAAAALLVKGRDWRSWNAATMPAPRRESVLLQNREALERLREGFQHDYMNPPFTPPGRSWPELSDFEALGTLLLLEGRQSEAGGKGKEATESYLDCLQLGTDLPRGGGHLHAYLGAELQSRALEPLQRLTPRMDGETALSLLHEMRELDRTAPGLREILVNERETTLRFLSYQFRTTSPLEVAPVTRLSQAPGPAFAYLLTPKAQMLRNYERYMDGWIALAAHPYYERSPAPERPGDYPSQVLVRPNELTWDRWALRTAQWRVTEAGLAVRAYEAARGHLPASLAQLVPQYLLAVPPDPFADQPLVFRRTGSGALVYSRGPDGDDDQGLQGSPKTAYRDGDIVRVVAGTRYR